MKLPINAFLQQAVPKKYRSLWAKGIWHVVIRRSNWGVQSAECTSHMLAGRLIFHRSGHGNFNVLQEKTRFVYIHASSLGKQDLAWHLHELYGLKKGMRWTFHWRVRWVNFSWTAPSRNRSGLRHKFLSPAPFNYILSSTSNKNNSSTLLRSLFFFF